MMRNLLTAWQDVYSPVAPAAKPSPFGSPPPLSPDQLKALEEIREIDKIVNEKILKSFINKEF